MNKESGQKGGGAVLMRTRQSERQVEDNRLPVAGSGATGTSVLPSHCGSLTKG